MLRLLVLLTAVLFASPAWAQQPQAAVNVLFLFTDDQRHDTIAALGHAEVKTPTLDKLVQNGFAFRNCYCMGSMVGAVCLPSRTMVMTGRSLWHIPGPNGKWPAANAPGSPAGNPAAGDGPAARGFATLPETFQAAGYATFRSGKKSNVFTFANERFQTNTSDDDRGPESCRKHADRAIEFLEKHDPSKPFLMVLDFAKPHDPRTAPAEYLAMYDPAKVALSKNFLPQHPFDNGELFVRDELLAAHPRTPEAMREHLRDYYAAITYNDAQIARILAVLDQRKLRERTLIVFSSDHGLAVGGQHGLMGKQNLYESNKAPLILSGPGVKHGQSDALVYLYDIFPTLCAGAGVATPETIEGKSLWGIVQGREQQVRQALLGAYRAGQRMVRDSRWKLIEYHAGGARHTQLFDLQSDPDEAQNLAEAPEHALERARLAKLLGEERKRYGDPVDFENRGDPASTRAAPKAKAGAK